MLLRTIGMGLIFASLAIAPAAARDSGRYQLERGEDGFVRLDTYTGQMSLCREVRNDLRCEAATDDIADLREENERLRNELRRGGNFSSNDLPTDEEVEEIASWFERVMVVMMRTMRNVEEEAEEDRERRRD